jgi:uncharacterized protein YbjT (DUF2867 family)
MTMNIAVVGGTGTVGSLAVAELARRGHQVRVLSRSPGAVEDVLRHPVDLSTGAGLDAGLAGVQVVLDAANATRGRALREVLVGGTRRLLEAGARAGVQHHVLISIVGIESVPVGYYKVKLEQEEALAAARVPVTVLRATQFHQLVAGVMKASSRFGVLPGGRIQLQPVDPAEVAVRLAEIIEGGPGEGRQELAGPEILPLGELARTWMAATGKRRPSIPIPPLSGTVRALQRGALTSSSASRGQLTFAEWLRRKA